MTYIITKTQVGNIKGRPMTSKEKKNTPKAKADARRRENLEEKRKERLRQEREYLAQQEQEKQRQITKARTGLDMDFNSALSDLTRRRFSPRLEQQQKSKIKELQFKKNQLGRLSNDQWLQDVNKVLTEKPKQTVSTRKRLGNR
jgi:hypothetical protein